jgi:hypothetical protein
MSSTSTPAAIFSSAACAHVANSSANASKRNATRSLVEGDVDLPAVEAVAERRQPVQALLVVRERAARARR